MHGRRTESRQPDTYTLVLLLLLSFSRQSANNSWGIRRDAASSIASNIPCVCVCLCSGRWSKMDWTYKSASLMLRELVEEAVILRRVTRSSINLEETLRMHVFHISITRRLFPRVYNYIYSLTHSLQIQLKTVCNR